MLRIKYIPTLTKKCNTPNTIGCCKCILLWQNPRCNNEFFCFFSTEVFERGTGTTPDPDALAIQLEPPDLPEIGRYKKVKKKKTSSDFSYKLEVYSKFAINYLLSNIFGSGRPRKSRDNLGVATPSYCIPGLSRADLAIIGERVVGQYNPISRGNLLKRLSHEWVWNRITFLCVTSGCPQYQYVSWSWQTKSVYCQHIQKK